MPPSTELGKASAGAGVGVGWVFRFGGAEAERPLGHPGGDVGEQLAGYLEYM